VLSRVLIVAWNPLVVLVVDEPLVALLVEKDYNEKERV
jgi:hypothetical protein